MDNSSIKRLSIETKNLKNKLSMPIILKNKTIPDENNKEKIKSLGYELKTIKEIIKSRNENDYLCEAFFACGASQSNSKILFDSEDSISSCYHPECSILPAMKAEIIDKFPIKNPNFEINSTTASLCFPSGVKVCYLLEDRDRQIKNNSINRFSSFVNVITNEKGNKFNLFIFEFFKKYEITDFQKKFKVDTLREYMKLKSFIGDVSNEKNSRTNDTINSINGMNNLNQNNNFFNFSFFNKNAKIKKDLEETISKNIEICSNFINKNYVYVPFKFYLVSKYGYSNQFEKCLEIILKMFLDDKVSTDEINKLLIHLIFEIPAPQLNKRILFYIPYRISPIEITENDKENPVLNYSLKSVVDVFSVENIIIIFNLILMEQKMIFVGNEYRVISEISQGFLSLMNPINWINTYVPVISEEMLKYLQSFMPFIMGVEESLIKKAKMFIEEDSIFIININKNIIDLSNNKKGKRMDRKYLLKNIPELPYEIFEELSSELNLLKKLSEENKNNINLKKFDNTIKEIFVKVIVMMIGDYKKYVSYIENIPLFNTDSFIINRPTKYKSFYTELTQSQIFRQFLHNDNVSPKINFEMACNRYSNSINQERRSSSKSFFRKISSVKNVNLLNNNISNNTTTVSLSPNIYQNNKNSGNSDNNLDCDSKASLENRVYNKCASDNNNINLTNATFKNSNSEKSIDLDNVGHHLITPYFINETLIKSDLLKIEEILTEKFGEKVDKCEISNINYVNYNTLLLNKQHLDNQISANDQSVSNVFGLIQNEFLLKNSILIIDENKELKNVQFEKVSENTFLKKYYINTEKKEIKEKRKGSFSFKSTNAIIHDSNLKALERIQKESALKKKLTFETSKMNFQSPLDSIRRNPKSCSIEIDELVENMVNNINESMRMILTSENLNNHNMNNMQKALNTRVGRSHFANILFQTKFKEMKTQILTENSFNNLFKLILISLIQSEDDITQYDDIRLVTKSTFCYYRMDRKYEYYIYQEIVKKQSNFKIWLNEDFWFRWFDLETAEEKNVFSKQDDFYFNILIAIANIMSSLGISLKYILKIIINNIASNILTDKDLVNELSMSISKQFHYKNN